MRLDDNDMRLRPATSLARDRPRPPAPRGAVDAVFERIVGLALHGSGIEFDGVAPWDPQIHDARTFRRMTLEHSIGAGESYMDGWWDCAALDQFFFRLFRTRLGDDPRPLLGGLSELLPRAVNLQSRTRSHRVNDQHYDLGNDLYEAMLDARMVYTCGYWEGAANLEEAQINKLELVCRKLGLQPGMRVLDIGCGFGSFLKYAAERHGIEGVGYTLSRSQHAYALRSCRDLPVEVRFGDYRTIQGRFDRIASIGMFEAVGQKNIRTFMAVMHRVIDPDGAALLHTIGKDMPRAASSHWVDKYIFPNGYIPELGEVVRGIEGLFRIEDLHNFGPDYDRTLMAWNERFQAAWPELEPRYGRRFRRMWEFYLMLFAGGFRAREWELWQLLLTPDSRLTQPSKREQVHASLAASSAAASAPGGSRRP